LLPHIYHHSLVLPTKCFTARASTTHDTAMQPPLPTASEDTNPH
jgi:hypothetical protein